MIKSDYFGKLIKLQIHTVWYYRLVSSFQEQLHLIIGQYLIVYDTTI